MVASIKTFANFFRNSPHRLAVTDVPTVLLLLLLQLTVAKLHVLLVMVLLMVLEMVLLMCATV